jgi:hypothetical protein
MKNRPCLFVEDVPKVVRNGFKAACSKKGKSMKEVLTRFMVTYTKRAGVKM